MLRVLGGVGVPRAAGVLGYGSGGGGVWTSSKEQNAGLLMFRWEPVDPADISESPRVMSSEMLEVSGE